MAYSRWTEDNESLYIWVGNDGLHVWPVGRGDNDGLFIKNDAKTKHAEKLLIALNDHLQSNGVSTRIRAGKVSFSKK